MRGELLRAAAQWIRDNGFKTEPEEWATPAEQVATNWCRWAGYGVVPQSASQVIAALEARARELAGEPIQ